VQGYRPGSADAGLEAREPSLGRLPVPWPAVPVLARHRDARAPRDEANDERGSAATAMRLDHSETPGFTLPSPEASGSTASGGIGSGRFGGVSAMVDNPIHSTTAHDTRDNEQHLAQLHRTTWR
jgi:hypothetical protein